MKHTIKIATIAAAEYNWSHGTTFTQIINGCTRKQAESANLIYVPPGKPVADDARVVAIWTPNLERTKIVAKRLQIPKVLSRPDEAIGQIDAVICCDDGCEKRTDRNAQWAHPYIAEGIPAFLDKPLSHSAKEAEEIISLARDRGTSILSCSGLRYSVAVLRQRENIASLGNLVAAMGTGPLGWLVFYGVHALDPLVSLFGTGAEWVQHLGTKEHHVVHVGYENGRSMVIQSLAKMAYSFHFSLFGSKGSVQFSVDRHSRDFARQIFHIRTAQVFLEMFRNGKMPVPYDEILEVAKILTYAKASLDAGGKKISLESPAPN